MNISGLIEPLVFVFGLMVGSFLNVCIWRLPAQEQVVRGRSRCRACQAVIAWHDNIPLLSFARLRGRCRRCGARISWLYPAVELAAGLLFLGCLRRFGPTMSAMIYGSLGASLLLVSVVDAREMIIPDEVTLPGIRLGLIVSSFFPALHGASRWWEGLGRSLLGLAAGGGLILGMGLLGRWMFRRKLKAIGEEEAVGGGDVKLMAMVGSVIGAPKTLLIVLFLAPFLGSVVGIGMKLRSGRELIPYGPFLALGTVAAIFWGDSIVAWYRSLVVGW
ncbi:MAG: prepilin peptidase [Candidatus Omnitrophica bacterium]|nr:prepilin peptidase [Candidatus Omnitrophota bacterium]